MKTRVCIRLQSARATAGLTQKDMSEIVGVPPEHISAFECGRTRNMYIAFHYMIQFGITPEELLDLNEADKADSEAVESCSDDAENGGELL